MNLSPNQKADVLIESLPYIKKFYNEIVVIKYGGSAMVNDELKESIIKDIVLMKYVGMHPVVVHGGGPEITNMLKVFDKESKFVDGLRVTDQATMEITEMVLLGKVCQEIVTRINQNGVRSIGICGKDGSMIKTVPKDPELGLVGGITSIDTDLIKTIIEKGYIPVISPIGCGPAGESHNINADEVAGKLAAALGAKKLMLITDVAGVLRDQHDEASLISDIKTNEIEEYIETGVIKGGMIPKISCCFDAVANGVERAHIIDGRKSHSMLLEIFTDQGVGTMITHGGDQNGNSKNNKQWKSIFNEHLWENAYSLPGR
ncbi:acetylglutamate kinase [Alkaliphilus metalliredigens QYMF]|uniref:Acetylglutamate kinase n=1 Tax=Alkaliphilus metalliredigens (strain QYMF) TaxID=293826 RepID=ARGB_ALKMQ|nr:acetylglutamate kinase [Alkaliphilus metalliredigens]A6TTJ1.1 RecName: Full=Acetylglutamate kinase; AltName: Full=N-acetyl-L-glutamate 5-phosphotransferase; AltName: Full=NAG kinase; Short=NAGK [Alkaliphilus metalliredigens QYMF]ABR49509.1 acetylglutamate kinase [Alkaliphilus metalliredigens QYMF]